MARPKRGWRVPKGLFPMSFEEFWDSLTAEQQQAYILQAENLDDGLCDFEELPEEIKREFGWNPDDENDDIEWSESEEPININDYIDTRPTMRGTVPDDYIKLLLPVLNKYLFYKKQSFDTLKEILCGDCQIEEPIRVRSTMLLAYVFKRLREKKLIAATWATTIEQFRVFLSVKNEYITSNMLRDAVKAANYRKVRNQDPVDQVL